MDFVKCVFENPEQSDTSFRSLVVILKMNRSYTYDKKCPVAKVVDGAEEPELVKEKVRSRNRALI